MTIQNLNRLINGEYLNKPSISSISSYAFEAKHVKLASAFFAIGCKQDEVDLAIKNGAYAIISEEIYKQSNDEIAYIKVSSIQTALMRLMRFESGYKDLRFYLLNAVQMMFLTRLNLDKNIIIIPNDTNMAFNKIMNAKNNDMIFSDNQKILSLISQNYDSIFSDTNVKIIGQSSIFFTSFICNNIYYQNLNIPKVFVKTIGGLLQFLNKNNINFQINDFKSLGHFEPIFIDKNFNRSSFGSSFRAIIIESDDELFDMEVTYLRKNFRKDDIYICVSKHSRYTDSEFFFYDDLRQIKSLKNFRYLLVKCKKDEILNILNEQNQTPSLF